MLSSLVIIFFFFKESFNNAARLLILFSVYGISEYVRWGSQYRSHIEAIHLRLQIRGSGTREMVVKEHLMKGSNTKFKRNPFRNVNTLNIELNPICRLLALLEARHILHVSRIRVKYE
jgi:hypothetical protein